MTTTLPRAATSPELALTRLDNQSHDLYLTIPAPATVYTARLAAVPTSTDKVASITYTSGSGTLANVLADMTLLCGSTAGGYDIGIARIRKDGATLAGTLYIGETSEIDWSTVVSGGIYLTVIDDFDLHPRHINMASDGTTPLMDYDLPHTDQNKAAGHLPIPIMGQDRVLWLRGTSVSITIYDAASSWVIDGTITDYAWVCAGATFDDAAIAAPTLTFSATGRYRVALTVTASNGKTYTAYRYIHVVTESSGVTTQFELNGPPSGSWDQGGWSFTVTLYDEATRALVRDRALVILHSVDYYGNTRGGAGYNTGSENIWCIGRIAKETIRRGTDDAYGSVTFEVQGPQFWWQMTAFAEGVIDVASELLINKWTKFSNLNIDKALYHFAMWRTTATRCMDVYPSGDTVAVKRLEEPSEFIWDQWVNIFWNSRRARPCCDRTGRLFLQIDQQLMLSRAAVPTVMAITTDDWYEGIEFDREIVPQAGRVDLSGTAWNSAAATVAAQFALSPGHVFKKFGSVVAQDRLALDGVQANTNTLAGLISAIKNNPYPKIPIKLASLHGLFDIAPHMRATLAIAAADSPRGIAETLTLISRSIAVVAGDNPGVYYQEIEFEAEVTAALAVTGDTPVTAPTPPTEPYLPPPSIIFPPITPPFPSDADEVWMAVDTAADDPKILWAGDLDPNGVNQPSFNSISLPTGYGNPSAVPFAYNSAMQIAQDGSALYLCGTQPTNVPTIWKLNVAAIRANPATPPTWTEIAKDGDVLSIGTLDRMNSGMAWVIRAVGSKLYAMLKNTLGTTYYGVYSGSSWAYTAAAGISCYKDAVLMVRNPGTSYVMSPSGTLYGSAWTPNAGQGSLDIFGQHNSTLNYWTAYRKASDTFLYLRHANSNAEYSTGDAISHDNVFIGGAHGGVKCYIHTATGGTAGKLYIATSGAAFSLFETFTTGTGGRVWDAKFAGGGALIRAQALTAASNTAIFTNPTRTAGAWVGINGDLDTVYPHSGSMTMLGFGLVYR